MSLPEPQEITKTLKLCNCARCGLEMLGLSEREWWKGLSSYNRKRYPPLMAGYIQTELATNLWHSRPYCQDCLPAARVVQNNRFLLKHGSKERPARVPRTK